MKEIIFKEAPSAPMDIPPHALKHFREVQQALRGRSTVVWGEHCSECAFPSCYSTCDFYTPRADLHCRRFMNGIETISVNSDPRMAGLTRIAFRMWGKLEGSGPVVLKPVAEATRDEKAAVAYDKILARLPLPRSLGSRLTHRLGQRRKHRVLADRMSLSSVFIMEGWLEQPEPVTMTVSMMPWSKDMDGLFQKQFTFRQGYNREIIPVETILRSLALDQPFAIQIEPVGKVPAQPVVFGLLDFAETSQPLKPICGARDQPVSTTPAKTAKCVVWDLDDTVWTGTLVEDGIEGVTLNRKVAEAMRLLDARGILNSVASKNDEDLALAALAHFGLSEYILFPQIGWGPKSDALRRIAQSIDIGIDTFVFVDDQPFERGEVGAAHASVTLMHPDEVDSFATHPLFDVPVTPESKKRRSLYRDEEKRHQAASSAGTDYLSFLRSCDIELEITMVSQESAERVYELTQRTNQLNVTGARFSRERVQELVERTSSREGYVLRCKDRFGDYGIIGFCVLHRPSNTIDAFFMSCRVQRKKVENAFFAWLSRNLAETGGALLSINYRKTAKNGAAVKLFLDLGFILDEPIPGKGVFTRQLSVPFQESDIVNITSLLPVPEGKA